VGNFSLVQFESDELESDEGFIVHWQCVDELPTTTVPPTTVRPTGTLIDKFMNNKI